MAFRWYSTQESIRSDEPTALAIVETLLAMGVTVWIAVHFQTYMHIAVSAAIAPLLLMRTDESARRCWRLLGKARASLRTWIVYHVPRSRSSVLHDVAKIVAALVVWPLLFPIARVAAWLVEAVRHPLAAVGAIPGNWRYSVIVLDFCKSPDLIPGPRSGEDERDERWRDVGSLARSIAPDFWKPGTHASVRIIRIIALLVAVPLILPAYLYRWSLKSTAVIWFPLLWTLRSLREKIEPAWPWLTIYMRDPVNRMVLVVSCLSIAAFTAKLVLYSEWAGFVAWWNETPLRQFLSLYVSPAEIQIWQVAVFVNSLLAFAMFILAKWWLVRVEQKQLTDAAWPRVLLRCGFVIRRVLSCYTIACTFYITLRAASDWHLPPLGSQVFPWM